MQVTVVYLLLQMYGVVVWMFSKSPWSLIMIFLTVVNCTFIGRVDGVK